MGCLQTRRRALAAVELQIETPDPGWRAAIYAALGESITGSVGGCVREGNCQLSRGDIADQLICDHALFHLEADLRWLELTAARLDQLAEAVAA